MLLSILLNFLNFMSMRTLAFREFPERALHAAITLATREAKRVGIRQNIWPEHVKHAKQDG